MKFLNFKPFRYITVIFFVLVVTSIVLALVNYTSSTAGDNYIYDIMIKNSIVVTTKLGVSVAILSSIIALFFAVANVFFEYKFKKVIHILTVLPMAIPSYIHAYNYSTMLDYGGSLNFLNINIRNLNGAIFIYSICLFPYIYLIVRSSLKKIPFSIIESAYFFYDNYFLMLYKVVLPIITKSLIAGIILVIAEVFSDIGVVEYFNIQTIAFVIKQIYTTTQDYGLALKIGYSFGVVIIILFLLENLIYPNLKYSSSKSKKIIKKTFTKKGSFIFYIISFSIFSLAFFIPIGQMIVWSFDAYQFFDITEFIEYFSNTTMIAIISLIFIIILGFIISHTIYYSKRLKFLTIFFNLGYILPSIIVSLVVIVNIGNITKLTSGNILLGLTTIPLIIAYIIKYLSIALNNISKSYGTLHPNIRYASLLLGKGSFKTIFNIDIPHCKQAFISASTIIVIDLYKELTLAYTLKPFNFHTLATKVAMFAKDERVQESAIFSLSIVFICAIAIISLERVGKND